MTEASQLAAAAVSLVFAIAALGKADSWPAWSRIAEWLPFGRIVNQAVRFAIPSAEGLVAMAAVAVPVWGLAAATVLLITFALAVLGLSPRLRGEQCNCFGAAMPSQIGSALAVRNLVLATATGLAALAAHHSAAPRPGVPELFVTCGLVGILILAVAEFRRMGKRPVIG